jgi:hypothetical protein
LIRAVLTEHFAGDRGAQQDGSAGQSDPRRMVVRDRPK